MTRPSVSEEQHSAIRPATIIELFDEYDAYLFRVRSLASDTIKIRRLYLNRAARLLSVGTEAAQFFALTPRHLMSAVAQYGLTYAPGSRCSLQMALRSILRFCYLRNYIEIDLSGWVPAFRRPRLASIPKAIPEEIVERLIDSIDPESKDGKRDAAIIAILSTYGVRGFQVRHLRLCDLDWDAGRILFSACKRGKPIIQVLTAEVGNRLSDYIRLERPAAAGTPEVFISLKPPHTPFKLAADLSRLISRRLRQAGLQVPAGVSDGTHGFRHAFASRLCGKVPFKYISDMLGHRDSSSVLVYAKVNFDDLAQTALPWPEGGVS
jgi:integrase/recombinase XerD